MKNFFLIKLGMGIVSLFTLIAATVVAFDPFFQYHKPIGPLKAVLTQAEYQVIGTLRNFDYDSLIVGSSMAENYHNGSFGEAFDCTVIKAVKQGANIADLAYLMEEAFKEREIKKIFYTLDISALTSTRKESFVNEGMPEYLYNDSLLDDYEYLFNKDVLFKEIPYMAAQSLFTDYNEGNSYNWAQYKDFSVMDYRPTEEKKAEKEIEEYKETISWNIDRLTEAAEAHPETEFFFIVPPYSCLWWYEAYMNGELGIDFYALEEGLGRLLNFSNVKIYYFQHIEEIITDLDYYMDTLHFHPDINEYILDSLQTGRHELTRENMDEILDKMKSLAGKCVEVYAREYLSNIS